MIEGIEQPDIIQINPSLRLRKFDGDFDFAIEWYQDTETIKLVDGESAKVYDKEIPNVDCFYSSLTLSFLSKKDLYNLWGHIITKLDKGTIIGINIFGDRDEWYRETVDMTFMNKEEFMSLFSNLTVLEFLEIEKQGTSMGTNGQPTSKKWHIFECIARL